MVLTHAEFASNNSMNRSIGKTPFQIVTRMQVSDILDLRDISGEGKC